MKGSTADTGIMGKGMADAGMVNETIPGADIVKQYIMGRSRS